MVHLRHCYEHALESCLRCSSLRIPSGAGHQSERRGARCRKVHFIGKIALTALP